jgi:hypothetical protein
MSLTILIILLVQTRSFGKKKLFSAARGNWKKGIIYAFGKGMMPWEKESAQKHLWTYMAGFGYHFGIFAAFAYLIHLILSCSLDSVLLVILRVFLVCGLACGLALFFKRSFVKTMKKLSCLDDYLANIFVDLFILLALLDTFFPEIRPFFYVQSIILLIYIPAGKIRHCFFFFYSRILFGHFFGRRGVLPNRQKSLEIQR